LSAPEIIGYVLVGLGLIAGAFLFARRPSFWIEFGARLFQALLPHITKRMDPETERRWRECERRGGKWDWHRKKCDR
jgi:hypothetical protein